MDVVQDFRGKDCGGKACRGNGYRLQAFEMVGVLFPAGLDRQGQQNQSGEGENSFDGSLLWCL